MDTKSFFEEIFTSFQKVLKPGQAVLTAVSGGGDSMAMLHLLYHFRKRLTLDRVAVAHVNHGLRGAESDAEGELVQKTAATLGFECFTTKICLPAGQTKGIEAWGRANRYHYFVGLAQQQKFDRIATAHTLDDQAETVLMRLMRGTSLKGLAGILPERADGVVRPLLAVRREALRAWLRAHTIPFCEDSSNQNPAFARNWVRLCLLPEMRALNPAVDFTLASLASISLRLRETGEAGAAAWVKRFVALEQGPAFCIKKEGLTDAHDAADGLAALFTSLEIECSRHHILAIVAAAVKTGGELLLPGGWRCYPHGAHLSLVKNNPLKKQAGFSCELAIPGATECAEPGVSFTAEILEHHDQIGPPPKNAFISKDNCTIQLDADKIAGLFFRAGVADDCFWPLGADEPVALRSYLKNQKIPREKRASVGVVATGANEIVWIPGVQIGHAYRITSATTRILRLRYLPRSP
ncbi:MAG: tRNA lysidine(34) synthetase TilS [Chitinivibrionales bacterium]|nr:tRNA lysidine(34) synthetase TilS [Chitinivibrionales bacterium]